MSWTSSERLMYVQFTSMCLKNNVLRRKNISCDVLYKSVEVCTSGGANVIAVEFILKKCVNETMEL